jgi:hypothetical protein
MTGPGGYIDLLITAQNFGLQLWIKTTVSALARRLNLRPIA